MNSLKVGKMKFWKFSSKNMTELFSWSSTTTLS